MTYEKNITPQSDPISQLHDFEYELMTYRLAIESMNIALWGMDVLTPVMTSPGDANIWKWSQEFRQLLGFSDEEDFPNTIEAFLACLHPEDMESAIAAFTAHFNDRTGNTPYNIEYRLRHKNGGYRHMDGFGTTLRDSEGIPLRVSGAVRDITEKKLIEGQIVEANENMVLILESMPVGVRVVSHDDGTVLYANRALIEILGGKDTEMDILGRSVFDFMPETQPNGRKTTAMVEEFIRTDKAIMDFQCYRADGTPFMARVSSCNINYMDHGSSLAIIEDLTEKNKIIENERRATVAEESSKAKSRFLANMSHEIRTPMNSILGFAELALDSKGIEPEIKDYLTKISDNAGWLLRIINDILDISKIEAGKMELEYVPFKLSDVFSRCQSVILPEVKEKGLDFSVYTEHTIGKQLVGDPIRLYQILMNLLSNAVKFTDAGKVWLSSAIIGPGFGAAPETCSLSGGSETPGRSDYDRHAEDSDRVSVYFEVKDSGIGMTPEQVDRIFEPFIQADSSTTRNYGGTGLGLSIVKNIVELMGGNLIVESSPGTGSRFCFELTFNTVQMPDELTSRETADSMERPYFNGLVLVCDDNRMNQEVICEHLDRLGIRAEVAGNGKEGVDLVLERKNAGKPPFDIIFMDMFMPVMDGIEAASKIISLDTGAPIVAMTANVMTSELERYKKNGMPECLGKPFTSQDLCRILLKFLPPVSTAPLGTDEADDNEFQKNLRINFFKNNQTTYNEIENALAGGDIKLAHRLTHTLKGNAGLIGKAALMNAAADVESILKNEMASVRESKMNLLKTELASVMEELKPFAENNADTDKPNQLTAKQALSLFDALEPLLQNINTECLSLLDDVRAVPGGKELARYIEELDFDAAANALTALRAQFAHEQT